jgi:toxin ParE1/3/4
MQVRWTEPASRDFTRICDYSGVAFGEARARRTALEIFEAVGVLADFPQRGRVGRRPGTLELVLSGLPFVVVYRVKSDVVEVLRILHGAQRWP